MQSSTLYPSQPAANRLLVPRPTLATIRRGLGRLRLPSYIACVRAALVDLADRVELAGLWQDIFGEPMPPHQGSSTLIAFFHRIQDERFSLDWDRLDLYAEYDNPIAFPIPVEGYGTPILEHIIDGWGTVSSLVPAQQAMAAALLGVLYGMEEEALVWWQQQGFAEAPSLPWVGRYEETIWRLGCLPRPLDGLAVLYQVTVKQTGNRFLDTSELGDPDDDGPYDALYWSAETVAFLADQWQAARGHIERLTAYYDWFHYTPDAQAQVIQILTSLDTTEVVDDAADDSA